MNHKQLVQQMAEMKAQLDQYQAEIDGLRGQVTSYENVETSIASAPSTSSRRKLLKRMAIAGIGGIGALGLAASVGSNNTVLAETAADNAIEATGGGDGYGLKASGGLAPLFLVGSGSAGTPSTGTHTAGELFVDNAGILYYCVTGGAGNAAVWRQVSGSTSSGVFHTLPSPERFVDTRSNLGGNGTLTRNNIVTFQMTGVNGQSGNAGLRIPTGATAIMGNMSAVTPTGQGNITLFPGNVGTTPSTVNINFPAGATVVGNNFTVGLSPTGTMKAVAGGGTGPYQVDLIIDVFGYYM